MAAMCFSAYISQKHVEINRADCFGGSAENFQKDLVKVFTGVKKNKTFNLTVATRHTIPELARCEPRSMPKKENRIKGPHCTLQKRTSRLGISRSFDGIWCIG
jgi:hypothetical protein